MNKILQNHLIEQYKPDYIIETLKRYISERRQQRIADVLDNRLNSIQIALEMPVDIHNAFAVMRSSEVFGLTKIHIIAPEKIITGMRQISKGALDWIEICFYDQVQEFLEEMERTNCRLTGALPKTTQTIHDVPIDQPICLFLGNEHEGLSDLAQNACDWRFQIPMYGMTESLNLSVAAGISLYEVTRRRREFLHQPGDLNPDERKIFQAKYYINSVSHRLASALFRTSL